MKRLASILFAAVFAVSALVGLPSPASAGPNCVTGAAQITAYAGSGYTDPFGVLCVNTTTSPNGDRNYGDNLLPFVYHNDTQSSFKFWGVANQKWCVTFYADKDWGGSTLTYSLFGNSYMGVSSMPSGWNDRVSSVMLYRC